MKQKKEKYRCVREAFSSLISAQESVIYNQFNRNALQLLYDHCSVSLLSYPLLVHFSEHTAFPFLFISVPW